MGNTAGATVSSVPCHGNFYPARGPDAMRERVAADLRAQLVQQNERLQRQRPLLELQEAELQRQRALLERQNMQLEQLRQAQQHRQASQTAPLVFWGPGGLLVPVARAVGSPDPDARRVVLAALVSPGLTGR